MDVGLRGLVPRQEEEMLAVLANDSDSMTPWNWSWGYFGEVGYKLLYY
jgi:hypothetical protein